MLLLERKSSLGHHHRNLILSNISLSVFFCYFCQFFYPKFSLVWKGGTQKELYFSFLEGNALVKKVAQEDAVTSFVDLTASSGPSLRYCDSPVPPTSPERHQKSPAQMCTPPRRQQDSPGYLRRSPRWHHDQSTNNSIRESSPRRQRDMPVHYSSTPRRQRDNLSVQYSSTPRRQRDNLSVQYSSTPRRQRDRSFETDTSINNSTSVPAEASTSGMIYFAWFVKLEQTI